MCKFIVDMLLLIDYNRRNDSIGEKYAIFSTASSDRTFGSPRITQRNREASLKLLFEALTITQVNFALPNIIFASSVFLINLRF